MKVKFCLLDADYIIEEEKPVVRLFGKTDKNKSVMVLSEYCPYFYALPKNKRKIEEKLKKNKMVQKMETVKRKIGLVEKDFLKVFVDLPPNVPKVRDSIKHSKDLEKCYEYTINFYKRYLMDKEFYPLDWLEAEGEEVEQKNGFNYVINSKKIRKIGNKKANFKIMAFDLEVVDSKIVMISVATAGFKKVLTYKKARNAETLKNEKEMLERFEELVNKIDPDIIVGYNSDEFDFDVLRSRADEYKLDMKLGRDDSSIKFEKRVRTTSARIKGRIHIDLFQFINNLLAPGLQSEVLTLNEVSLELLGTGKEDVSFEDIISLWKSGSIEKLVIYCQTDSILALELAELLLVQIFELSKVSGQMPFDTSRMTYGLLSEWFFVRKAAELDIISPNQPHWDEIQKRRMFSPFRGGYVKEPKPGLHDDIAVFDFRSLYPSIIVTFNISPETLNARCKGFHKVPGFKHKFCKDKKGFISQMIGELIKKRLEIKDRLKKARGEEYKILYEEQNAVKILSNAAYGMFGNASAKWYCRECAESSAAFGRFYIKKSIEAAEKFGFNVLYSDTDSLFVNLKKNNIEKGAKRFLEKINKSLPGILELDLQGIYKKGLFVPQRLGAYTAKKRYALLDKKGNLVVRGMEAVRRDWCDLAKNLQHEVLRLVLLGKEEKAVNKVKETIKKIKARKVEIRDIAIRTQLGKELSEYKAKGPHIEVAKKLEKRGHEVHAGIVLSYVITKGKGSISDRAEAANEVNIKDYDIDYYLKNQVISVALRVLSVLGYEEKDFLEGGLKKFVKK